MEEISFNQIQIIEQFNGLPLDQLIAVNIYIGRSIPEEFGGGYVTDEMLDIIIAKMHHVAVLFCKFQA